MGVSSRGNAESILSALVLGTLLCMEGKHSVLMFTLFNSFWIQNKGLKWLHQHVVWSRLSVRRLTWAAALYGLSVHMKIYPVTYALPIALSLRSSHTETNGTTQSWTWKTPVAFVGSFLNSKLILFASVAGGVFFTLTALFYYMSVKNANTQLKEPLRSSFHLFSQCFFTTVRIKKYQ